MLTNAVSASECASRVRMFAKAQALGVNMGLAMQAADGAAGGTGAQAACWFAPWICTADTSEVFCQCPSRRIRMGSLLGTVNVPFGALKIFEPAG